MQIIVLTAFSSEKSYSIRFIAFFAYWNKSTLYSNAFLLSSFSTHDWLMDSYFDFNFSTHFKRLHFLWRKAAWEYKGFSTRFAFCFTQTHLLPLVILTSRTLKTHLTHPNRPDIRQTSMHHSLVWSLFRGVLKNKIKVHGVGAARGKQF